MTLRLPAPGASIEAVLEEVPECELDSAVPRCRFHGWIRPLPAQCEDGCTWWTYRFVDDRLDVAELERSVFDADAEYAARFADEAALVEAELTRRHGAPSSVDHLGRWASVESSTDGGRVLLERRVWALDDRLVTWELSGQPGHHPGVLLKVRVEVPRPPVLRIETLEPGLATGSPFLRLRGGPLERPLNIPLWLTFDARDREQDNCELHHEATVFPLADGRLYIGQYNSWCGGPRLCRILDPRDGRIETPPGGCLWGEGIHHRIEAIGGAHFLVSSDTEGTGAVQIVRYDSATAPEVVLELSISSHAPLNARVRDGGVDFSTVCDLPPGCRFQEYGEVPSRDYRWTADAGLVRR